VKAAVDVENTGKVAGEQVVQLNVALAVLPPVSPSFSHPSPIWSLAGLERIALRPGERKTVQFTLAPRQFSTVSVDGRRFAQPGAFEISAGGGRSGAASATLRIGGAAKELHWR
jgi:beta-glucosidase